MELKPCPFCGGEAFVRIDVALNPTQARYNVGCDKNSYCHGWYGHSRYYNTEAEAAAAWNTRTDYHGYEQAAIEAWKSVKNWNTRHVETCTIGDYKDPDYGYTHTAMWNDEWFMPSGRCSGCGEYIPVWNYCPNCGRKVVSA